MRTRQRNNDSIFRHHSSQANNKDSLVISHTNGPFENFNPTSSLLQDAEASILCNVDELTCTEEDEEKPISRKFSLWWSSRDNRKGRHAFVTSSQQDFDDFLKDDFHTKADRARRGICRMFLRYPVWDISYLVAVLYTIGALVWIVDGVITLFPVIYPEEQFNSFDYPGGILAFVGTSIMTLGAILQWLELVNEKRDICFGWTVEQYHGKRGQRKLKIRKTSCSHHQGTGAAWRYIPTWKEFREYHYLNISFYATVIQLLSASIFWMTAVARLPPIYDIYLSHTVRLGLVWIPKIIGAFGFTVSSLFLMVETQERWWKAALGTLGWYISALGVVGSIGFVVVPCLVIHGTSFAAYWACVLTIVAGATFLFSGLFSIFEALEKHSVHFAPAGIAPEKDNDAGFKSTVEEKLDV